MIAFEAWPKTPRLNNGGVTITEKIDGTNACVVILEYPITIGAVPSHFEEGAIKTVGTDRGLYIIGAQSRKKLIFPGKNTDNAGFAGWVDENASELVDLLGPGRHFGEWWGSGIQRRYNMDRKVFSLFNTHRWGKVAEERQDWRERARGINMTTVPVLHVGAFSDLAIDISLGILRTGGSIAAAEWGFSGFRAEGIIIRHRDLGGNLKVLLDNDDVPKSVLEVGN